MGIQFLLFIAVYIYFLILDVNVAPNIYALLIPVLIIMLAGLALGFGILISSLTTKYRDLTILFTFVVQLWMYATPVIYPLSTMSPKRQWIMALNPVTSIVETFKYGTMGVGTFNWGQSYLFICFYACSDGCWGLLFLIRCNAHSWIRCKLKNFFHEHSN